MRGSSAENKINQAIESVRICKFNIENQQKKLEELNIKINKIASTNSLPTNELKKLMVYANVQRGLILELQGEFNLNENRLKQLRSIGLWVKFVNIRFYPKSSFNLK